MNLSVVAYLAFVSVQLIEQELEIGPQLIHLFSFWISDKWVLFNHS